MQQTNELSTKNASQLLEISVSSMRLYAQTMEAMGYEFKKVDNARRFTKYDLQLISEAMERFKLVGGTMKQALHYMIVKFEQGKEVADAIPTPVTEKNSTPTDLQELQNNMVNQINTNVHDELENHKRELLQAIKQSQEAINDSEDINTIKEENERLKALYKESEETTKELAQENKKLKNEMDQLNSMSMWEFRKWKKDK